jgi:hypothetical protein
MKVALLCLCMMTTATFFSQDKGWRGIVPLHSTRADVEKLLGSSTEPNGYSAVYELKDEVVSIVYSSGPCRNSTWKVPADIVVSVSIGPRADIRFYDLTLDRSKYKRVEDPFTSHVAYINEEDGVTYSVVEEAGKGSWRVLRISYEPTAKDAHLRCPATTAKKPCGGNQKN